MDSKFSVSGYPTLILIDKEGIIRYRKDGFNKEEGLKALEVKLQELLIAHIKVSISGSEKMAIAAILDTISRDDQSPRLQLKEIQEKYGLSSAELQAQWRLIARNDSVNVEKINPILDKYGWLGKDNVGEQGNQTLFLVIQHADLTTQLKYLPLLRNAVKQGKARPSILALLEDRTALRQGKKQIYGSQIMQNGRTGKYFVQPMEDPEHVDKRRAEVGLAPIKEYVSQWGDQLEC